jgi:AraC-like DNA-binding protein
MLNSDILNEFDESRKDLKPYGLTCELWSPGLMRKPDRHNEIELNYFSEGALTYLFQDTRITIPAKRLALFWALVPHQIVHYQGTAPYFVCTIPFSFFLEWKLPASFVERILRGELLIDASEDFSLYDEFLIKNWLRDISNKDTVNVISLELRARISRMAIINAPEKARDLFPVNSSEINAVEKIAIYIARNYSNPITVSNIGNVVELHPDYANTLFKKAFGKTLSEYIIEERISHAQRKLVATDKSITEIAFDCGFNSMSSFNAAFRKINCCTPREFRKNLK